MRRPLSPLIKPFDSILTLQMPTTISTGGRKSVPSGAAEVDTGAGKEVAWKKKRVVFNWQQEARTMSGPKPSYPICLTEAEVKQLQKQERAQKTGQSVAIRARILLSADEHPEWSNQQIAVAVGTTDRTVRKWRGRWVATHSIADAPRSGAPRRFGAEVRAQATAVACSLPRQSEVPLSRWSRTSIAREVGRIMKKITRSAPSARTVGRWLKGERIRPWRYHHWQHIHDPEQFLQRARPVLQLYPQAKARMSQGIWLVCMDEKTSIQAREGEEPPRPAQVGSPQLQESRYLRRGALHLFAAPSVADGVPHDEGSAIPATAGFPLAQAGVALHPHVPESRFSHPCTPARFPGTFGLSPADTAAALVEPAGETAQDREYVANDGSAMAGSARLSTSVQPCGPRGLTLLSSS